MIERYIKQKDQNNLEKNLALLKKLSKPTVKYSLIKPAMQKLHRNERINEEGANNNKIIKAETETSVFTEEDFRDFEKTYFKS